MAFRCMSERDTGAVDVELDPAVVGRSEYGQDVEQFVLVLVLQGDDAQDLARTQGRRRRL